MKRRKTPAMSKEDKILWNKVAETTTPLSPQRGKFLKQQMTRLMEDTASVGDSARSEKSEVAQPDISVLPSAVRAPKSPITNHPIDKPVIRKLAKGRVQIDSRIDLHGMTQDRAQFALLDFLQMAQRSNHRIVLVITGKGSEGRGVLRQNVPRWLNQSRFAALVNGSQAAHSSHGGEGALYVRIRKRPGQGSR